MPSGTGKCILAVVQNLSEVCIYLRNLTASLTSSTLSVVQFDLHHILMNKPKRVSCKPHLLKSPALIKLSSTLSNDFLNRKRKIIPECQHGGGSKHVKYSLECEKGNNGSIEYIGSQSIREKNAFSSLVISDNIRSCNEPFGETILDTISEEKSCTKLYKLFQSKIKEGPNYICSCCTQLFFKHSFSTCKSIMKTSSSLVNICLTKKVSVDNEEWICNTCKNALKQGKIPACSVANKMTFPKIPEELKITQMEERLIAPRLAFMQLKELPRGGQIHLTGNVVNVPADVNTTVKQLPRMMDNSETIPIKLKRKISHKNFVAFEQIRPNKVLEAAKWLVQNSKLFKKEGIEIDSSWMQKTVNGMEVDENQQIPENDNELFIDSSVEQRRDADDWTEDEYFHERITGNTDTVLQPLDFREYNQVLSLAPGENQSPLGLFQDMNSEYLAFPTLYCGETRPDNSMRSVPVHYSTICKWELRNADRRTAMCIPNIFFKLKKLQIKQIRDKVYLAVRKCKTKGKKMSVSEILAPDFVDNLVKQNDGFRVLRTLRGSPPYWEQAKKDVFAMIKQLGMPTWFCSFSAAETKWAPLLKCLSKLVHNKVLTSEEVESLTWKEKCILIKSDPVTCARYFDHRFHSFFFHVMRDKIKPIGEIIDFFYRIEFQQRGSPHVHMLIWIKNAPVYNNTNEKEVASFIEKHVSCEKDKGMANLVNYQTHRHARTCRKKGKAICRFNFPIPPMPFTTVLDPPADEVEKVVGQQAFQKVAKFLFEFKSDSQLSFDDFLCKLDLTMDSYLQALRSSLSVSKVFFKALIGRNQNQ